jgi:predicted ATPase/class 3 adenylate cyclase
VSGRPTGTVTFLFTDVAASTRLWERDSAAMAGALERHDELCRLHFDRHGGYVFATGGDGFAVAFQRTSDAVEAARALQDAIGAEPWPVGARVAVRMAVHVGETVERGGDYFGPTVNTVARLLGAGHGGQILLSDAATQLLRDRTELRDLGVHHLRDLVAPMRIWQVGDGSFPTLRSLDAAAGNLPSHGSALVGREPEMAALLELISAQRLVTLAGVGGVGKTRLAIAVAEAARRDHPDGAWFVDLTSRESDDDLAGSLSVAIGADATASERRLLLEHLRERHMLLVVDNCEHVIDAAADLVQDVLAVAPHITVLATSREPLGVDGEHVHRVRSLSVPDASSDADAILTSPAVTLFLDRARDAGASPDAVADRHALAEICRQLDGIPLAIELAAARTRAMSATEMATRLDERFRLLGGGRRSRERHRTLMATVRWSHDLLTEPEQVVWRRLAAFVGGFDLAAAEAVVDRADTLEAVLSLVDKSMVQVDTRDGHTRYSMLETLRQFAADQLTEAGEVDQLRARHAEHFLTRFGTDGPALRGPREHETWRLVALDRDNIVVAAERLLEHGRADDLITTMTAAPQLWIVTAPADGGRLLEVAASATADARRAARALGFAAFLAWESGDPGEGRRLALVHLERCAELGEPPSGWGLTTLLILANFEPSVLDDHLVAVATGQADIEGDLYLSVCTNALVGTHRRRLGDPDWRDSFARAGEIARQLDSSSTFVVLAVTRASEEVRAGGNGDRAAAEILAPGEHHAAVASTTPAGWFHLVFGRVLFDLDRATAVEHLKEALRIADRLGSSLLTNLALEGLGLACALDGRLADAAILRAVSRAYFDTDGGPSRGDVATPLHDRLDAILVDALSADQIRESDRIARGISRPSLLALALATGSPVSTA